MLYFNTAFAASMVPDGDVQFFTFDVKGIRFLIEGAMERGEFANVANPTHANTLRALSSVLGIDLNKARGGRVFLKEEDVCIVAQISGLPRETREFTDEEVAAATFTFRVVRMVRISRI